MDKVFEMMPPRSGTRLPSLKSIYNKIFGENEFKIRSLQGNTFQITNGETKILVDPWLEDDAAVGIPFINDASKKYAVAITPEKVTADAIVISNASEECCHVPTLKYVDKATKIIASPEAASVCEKLGFKNVVVLDHNQ